MNKSIYLLLAILAVPLHARGETSFEIQSPETRVSLIELFTSEGCSSCPPADRWVGNLRNESGLWKQFVPIAFHVDYWNGSWHDPFSRSLYTDRQRQYASQWNSGQIYTPEFVLNGTEWREAMNHPSVPTSDRPLVGKLTVKRVEDGFEVTFQPKVGGSQWVVNGTLLGNGLLSRPSSGENGGATLRHEFVALGLETVAMTKSGDKMSAHLHFASPTHFGQSSLAIAIWVTHPGDLTPVQAVGGDLP